MDNIIPLNEQRLRTTEEVWFVEWWRKRSQAAGVSAWRVGDVTQAL